MRSLRAQMQKGGILSPSSKFARRERISHTEIDPLYVIPAAGGMFILCIWKKTGEKEKV